MTPPPLNFTAYRDADGYRIVEAKPAPPPKKGQSFLGAPAGMPAHTVGNGGKPVPVRINDYPLLFAEFASIDSETKLLAFITKFGPLTNPYADGRSNEEISYLLDRARQMKKAMQKSPKSVPSIRMSNLKAWLAKDPTSGALAVRYSPSTLLDTLWIQLGYAMSDGAEMRKCRHCGEWFVTGQGMGRRRIAEFCSDEHRKRFNSLARSNPALRRKRK
jgi:hypothetical protein